MGETDDVGLLREDAVLVDVGPLEVVRATGADRVTFLHRVLTSDVQGTLPGRGIRALLLTVKGHVVSDLRVFVSDGDVRLVVPPAQGEATAAALGRYAIMDDFTAAPDPALRLLALHGPRAAERLAAAGITLPATRWGHVDVGALWVIHSFALGADGAWIFGSSDAVAALEGRLGLDRLRGDVAEAVRIEAGEPRFGAEITPDYFPMEVGLDRAIDYAKGCYLGQEPIVRIRDRGHINWRLVGLRLRGDQTPSAGDRLEADVKPKAGRVTSAGRRPGQPPVALALLHVSVPVGAEVRVLHEPGPLVAEVVEAAALA